MNNISVVIPAYQAEDTICRSVKSAFNIGSSLFEVIVVDDGSTDETCKIVEKLAVSSSKIKLIRQNNMGRSAARNTGFKAALADWVMFLDADDFLFPGDYEKLVGFADDKELGLLVCKYLKSGEEAFEIHDTNDALSNVVIMESAKLKRIMVGDHCRCDVPEFSGYELNAAWARLYRREVIAEVANCLGASLAPFPLGLRFSEDRLFNLEYLWMLENEHVGFVPFYAYCWDIGNSSTCSRVRPRDVDSLSLFASVTRELEKRSVFSSRDRDLVLSREFIEQFKRAAQMSRDNPEISAAWIEEFDSAWLKENLKEFPSDCLGVNGQWGIIAKILAGGHLGFAFNAYTAISMIKAQVKRAITK